jgi:hypothetical protein
LEFNREKNRIELEFLRKKLAADVEAKKAIAKATAAAAASKPKQSGSASK